jgi:hypothetical protein
MNKGLIKINNEFYTTGWDTLHLFMKDFRPTHIEFRHWENDTWYMYGVSKLFDELKEGDSVPHYNVVFTQNENNNISYKFNRV